MLERSLSRIEFVSLVRRPFLRQALGTYGTQILIAAFSLITSAIIARALGPTGRGDYAVAMAIGAIGVQLANLGLQSTNSYSIAKDRALLPSLLANSLFISFVLGGAGAAILGSILYLWTKTPLQGALLWLAVLWIPFGLAYLLVVNLLMGLLEVKLYNAVELLNRLLATALVIAAVWLRVRSPGIMFLLVLLALIVSFSFAVSKLKRFSSGPVRFSKTLFHQNFRLGWKAYLCCLFAFLVIRIDLLMVKSILGAAAAGYYSIAGTIADYLLLLPTTVGAVLFPRLSAMSHDGEKRRLTVKAAGGTAVGLLALLLLLLPSARLVIAAVFGSAFLPAAMALLLLLPGVLFLGVETVLVQYLNSRGFPVSIVGLWIISTLLNIGLNLWAIPAYGIDGAAVVSSVSYLLALLGVVWLTYSTAKRFSTEQQSLAAANGPL